MKRLLVIASLLASPLVASAYDVKTTPSGADVHWKAGSIIVTPALTPAPTGTTTDAATAALTASVATWQNALVGTDVSIEVASAPVVASTHTNDGVSTVRFALSADDPDIEAGVLALTFVQYQTTSGVAVDADLVMNASSFTWGAGSSDCVKEYDLESALTHELGHALGLAHAIGHPEATMYATGEACETTKRDLSPDDRAGLDSLYRASTTSTDPSMGSGGCSSTGGGALLPVVIALALLFRRRLAVVSVVAALAVPVSAAQLRALTIEDLAHDAVIVVRGHVVASAVTPRGPIETDTTLAGDECLAGPCPGTAVIRRRGGERDDVGLLVDAEAALQPGSEIVVYLRRDRTGTLRVLGGIQGLWQLSRSDTWVRDLRGQHVLVTDHWEPGSAETITLTMLRTRTVDARANAADTTQR
ncbi:hypothetical protein BH11MYX1_BH11MYX1_10110 [soil metagenome]